MQDFLVLPDSLSNLYLSVILDISYYLLIRTPRTIRTPCVRASVRVKLLLSLNLKEQSLT